MWKEYWTGVRVPSSPPNNKIVALLRFLLFDRRTRKGDKIIKEAKESCKNSDISVFEHFVGADKMFK